MWLPRRYIALALLIILALVSMIAAALASSGWQFESSSYRLRAVDAGGVLLGSSASYRLQGVHEAGTLLGSSSSYKAYVDRAKVIETGGLLLSLTAVMGASPNPLMEGDVTTVYASITYDAGGAVFTGSGVYINSYLATYDSDSQTHQVKFTASSPSDVSFTVTDIDNEEIGSFTADTVIVRWNPYGAGGAETSGVGPVEGEEEAVPVEAEALGPLEHLAALLNVPLRVVQLGVFGLLGLMVAVPVYRRATRPRKSRRVKEESSRLRSEREKAERKPPKRVDRGKEGRFRKKKKRKREETVWDLE